MADKEVKQWITVNGKHIPIFKDTKTLYDQGIDIYKKLTAMDKELKVLEDKINKTDGPVAAKLMSEYKKLNQTYKENYDKYIEISSEFNSRSDKNNYLQGRVRR